VVAGSERFSLLDGYSGYNQIMVKEDDQFKMISPLSGAPMPTGRCPFGLSNVGATFQR
ncbi:hypothetical protein KI387_010261, partial [Taxus chinensis]